MNVLFHQDTIIQTGFFSGFHFFIVTKYLVTPLMNSCLHIFNYTCISDIIYIKLLYTNIIFALRIMSGIVFLIRIYNCFHVCCAIFTSFVLHVQILHLPGKPFSWSCMSCTKYLWSVQVFVLLLNNFVHKIPSYAFE